MIAQRIFEGDTAEQIGIGLDEYMSRKATLDRYLSDTGGDFDQSGYLAWLQNDQDGDRGGDQAAITSVINQTTNRPSGALPATGRRSCCGGGKIR